MPEADAFANPLGLGVNQKSGDVYVADQNSAKGAGLVDRFTAAGEWKSAIEVAPGVSGNESYGLAVDNSGGSSEGDVYVADITTGFVYKFDANAEGELTPDATADAKFQAHPVEDATGVAVDADGDVYVASYSTGTVAKFSSGGELLDGTLITGASSPIALAVAPSGNIYVAGLGDGTVEYEPSGSCGLCTPFDSEAARGIAVDGAGDVFVAEQGSRTVKEFGPGPAHAAIPNRSLERAGVFGFPFGLAVSTATSALYVADLEDKRVDIFRPQPLAARTVAASEVTSTTATLKAKVALEGGGEVNYHFDYGKTAGYGEETAEANVTLTAGADEAEVSAEVTGLNASETYHYKIVASDLTAEAAEGGDETLRTHTEAPIITEEASATPGATEVGVSARVDPGGLPTSYHVEYGTSASYGSATSVVNAGAGSEPVNVQVRLGGLQPETTYRARVVAANALGATTGRELTFTTTKAQVVAAPSESACPNRTYSGFNTALPDCRAYELVSDPIDEAYIPDYNEPGSEASGTGERTGPYEGTFRAAENGEGLSYTGGESDSGVGGSGATGNGDGNQYLSMRGPDGWNAQDISLPSNAEGSGAAFSEFSGDLSLRILLAGEPIEAAPASLADCKYGATYSNDASGFHALVTMNQGSGRCTGEPAGISANDEHILFESGGGYTTEAVTIPIEEKKIGGNLYDSVKGSVHQVNILPDGEPEKTPAATFGINFDSEEYFTLSGTVNQVGDINSDGSRIVWTALQELEGVAAPKALYVRENDSQPQSQVVGGRCTEPSDACTVQLDAVQSGKGTAGEGLFWAAADDGAKVFFTDCQRLTEGSTADPEGGCLHRTVIYEPPTLTGSDLYEYDFEKPVGQRLADLTVDHNPGDSQGADVQSVIGTSRDGSYVYIVADGVLAGSNREGKVPAAGQPNLYELHEGATMFIATLSPYDNELAEAGRGGDGLVLGDWQIDPGMRSAEVSPNGEAVAFLSRLELTGYGNEELSELFVFQASTGRIVCASCSPTGAPPAPASSRASLSGTTIPTSNEGVYMERWIADRGGTQVYFMTDQPLVADDTNGLLDVYEWRSDGSDGCTQPNGCDALLSTAEPTSNAYLLGTAMNGRDVFFTTASSLTSSGLGEQLKVYDARVDGGFPKPSLTCSGTGCQGAPPALPIFATPASATFNGVGNFPPPAPPKPTVTKKTVKCKKGDTKNKKGKCVKKPKKSKKAKKTNRRAK
jgi:hypothetical protein